MPYSDARGDGCVAGRPGPAVEPTTTAQRTIGRTNPMERLRATAAKYGKRVHRVAAGALSPASTPAIRAAPR
jgi:hypothetical protein